MNVHVDEAIGVRALPHVTISPTISLPMSSSTMEFNEIVDDGI